MHYAQVHGSTVGAASPTVVPISQTPPGAMLAIIRPDDFTNTLNVSIPCSKNIFRLRIHVDAFVGNVLDLD
jgi:hypothetical protein